MADGLCGPPDDAADPYGTLRPTSVYRNRVGAGTAG
jgi:hypothetical protein